MSLQRIEYFRDLLADACAALEETGVEPQDHALVLAALIESDAANGIRKALLDLTEATRKAGRA